MKCIGQSGSWVFFQRKNSRWDIVLYITERFITYETPRLRGRDH